MHEFEVNLQRIGTSSKEAKQGGHGLIVPTHIPTAWAKPPAHPTWLAQVGEYFGVSYATVSQAVKQVEGRS